MRHKYKNKRMPPFLEASRYIIKRELDYLRVNFFEAAICSLTKVKGMRTHL